MLKLQYTETGLFIEQVNGSLEALISQRVILAMRVGQELHVQPGQASFLLANSLAAIAELAILGCTVSVVDPEMVEVCLDGIWITEHLDAEEGTFMIAAPEQTEGLLYRLWQTSQTPFSSLA